MQTPIAGNLLWCLEMYSVLRGGGDYVKLLFWENRFLDLLIRVGLGGDPLQAAFDPAILAICGLKTPQNCLI